MSRPDIDGIEARARAATPGRWQWWTLCSFRRLKTTDGKGIAEPTVQRSDGQPDIQIRDADAAHIAGMDPAATLALLAYVRELEAEAETLRAERAEAKRALAAFVVSLGKGCEEP